MKIKSSSLLKSNNFKKIEGTIIYLIFRGEFVMIRGPSGGGKTTLLNLLGTIDMSSSGTISKIIYPHESSTNNLI